VQWSIIGRKRFVSLLPAIDRDKWYKYSPGLLHVEEMINWSIENGMDVFDLGVGDEPYKELLENVKLPLYRVEYPRTLVGRSYMTYLKTRRALASTALGKYYKARKARKPPRKKPGSK
jgi:CelD/BcsL family acetyltransferase involved in cellulose biosynthesis